MHRHATARLLVFTAALAALTGCPGQEEGDPTGSSEGTTEQATTSGSTEGSEILTDAAPTTETAPATDTAPAETDTTDADTTIDPTTGDPDPVCECISVAEFGGFSYTCGEGACGLLNPSCVEGDGDSDTDAFGECELSIEAEQVDCALDLLIAGESGVVKWVYSADQGFSENGGFVQLLPERKGLTRTWEWLDLDGNDSAAGVVSIKPAAYFEACKAMPDPAQRFLCLRDWSDQQPAAQCDEPGYQSDI